MKKISAILAFVVVFTMTVMPVSAAEISFGISANAVAVQPGESITLTLSYTPSSEDVACLSGYLKYDPTLVSYTSGGGMAPNDDGNGKVMISLASATSLAGTLTTIVFTAKAEVNGNAEFSLVDVTDIYSSMYDEHTGDATNAKVTVKIGDGGSEPDPDPVFTVDKAVEGNAVKVTVANASEAPAGQIYVATFDNGVLVDCQVQDIANGTLTFSGLDGNIATAQMFVWDNNNVPIEYATTPAQ